MIGASARRLGLRHVAAAAGGGPQQLGGGVLRRGGRRAVLLTAPDFPHGGFLEDTDLLESKA